ncbi:5-formyltetrahydrofolate cyclo-ligase [Geomonas sp. Red32]|uniref:5-formyltetrahydrofolate cyclo-ligase n=1 Tax=Geomonas sp. Red32 TaxID=2912856 RepID=UPI00202CDB20|nr:5-formyltetrahydrofolate cyclo-ligase [Geomonas sp. Red32]MCM0082668.1 5-formyltetrahydrofolate cyclo-ligase [Geomonas sp. Red32]
MPKRSLRAAALSRRREMTAEQVASHSAALQRRFLELPEFLEARSVASYAPVHGEVRTDLVAQAALAAGKKLLYPAVVGEDLQFREVASLEELVRGKFGIPEPVGAPFDVLKADLIVVPGVAFDICGRRIGYGKGFYDRTLHTLERTGRLVGFCYDFQLVAEIVGEPHDVTMDVVVTEVRLVRVNNNICEGEPREN